MTTYRPLSRAKVDEELWETEGERGVGRGEWGEGGRVGPGQIIAHSECAALKTNTEYTLGQQLFS